MRQSGRITGNACSGTATSTVFPTGKNLPVVMASAASLNFLGQVDYDTGSIREEKDLTGLLRAVKQKFPRFGSGGDQRWDDGRYNGVYGQSGRRLWSA